MKRSSKHVQVTKIAPAKMVAVQSYTPGQPDDPCTEVHITYELDEFPGVIFALRFKNPTAVDSLISALIEHRVFVWGEPKQQ